MCEVQLKKTEVHLEFLKKQEQMGDVSDQTVTLPHKSKFANLTESRNNHQKPHNVDFLSFRWLCMGYQINERKI